MSTRLVSLGDSFSCGEGVGLRVDLTHTWGGLLAAGLPHTAWTPLATPGARVRDVLDRQLPAALAARPHVATLLVGLNDVIRPGFESDAVAADLRHVVAALTDGGCVVLLARLHDPGKVLGLPGPLRRAVTWRVGALNAAVDQIVASTGSPLVDLGRIDRLAESSSWAVDRLHPSPAGHREMAVAAAQALRAAGLRASVERSHAVDPAPRVAASLRWLLVHGMPWGAAQARSVGLPLLTALGRRYYRDAFSRCSHSAVAVRPASSSGRV